MFNTCNKHLGRAVANVVKTCSPTRLLSLPEICILYNYCKFVQKRAIKYV